MFAQTLFRRPAVKSLISLCWIDDKPQDKDVLSRAVGSGEAGEALASPAFNPYSYISMLTFL